VARDKNEQAEPMKKKVLVVEDSVLMQRVIGDIISLSDDFEVCAFARDVVEGWAKFNKYSPDLVTLDFELPGENGLALLKKIMDSNPIPVLMLSAHTKEGAELTMRSLEMGAVDFFTKPAGPISIDLFEYKYELLSKLKGVAEAKFSELVRKRVLRKADILTEYYVGIASSTGGVHALNYLIPSFPPRSGLRTIIVQHMPKYFTGTLAQHLNERSSVVVKEAQDGDPISPGEVLIAPGGYHIQVHPSGVKVILTDEPPRHGVKPSADILFVSMAEVFGNKAIGVVLTGMGHDGALGLRRIKECGGMTIVQDPSEATISSMPQTAIDTGLVDFILPLNLLLQKIWELIVHD
jgi:two-component system chemotaxis response regulator CheB